MAQSTTVSFRPALLFGGLLLLALLIEYTIIQQPAFRLRPELPAAVALDLLVGIPLLFYGLVVRRYRLPATTVGAVFSAMLAVGFWLVPAGQQQYLQWGRHLLVLPEGLAVVMMAVNIRRLLRAYIHATQYSADIVENLHAAFTAVFRRAWAPLVSELAMFRYALLSWRARPEVGPGQQAFSTSRESGFRALLLTVMGVSVVEMVVAHLLLSRWNATAALVALLLSAYTLLFLLAHLRAVPLRPVLLDGRRLIVRTGFMWRLEVPAEAVLRLQLLSDTPAPRRHLLNLAKPLLTAPNVLLTFSQPVAVAGLYGLRRTVWQVALYVDDRAAFARQLQAATRAD
ncbi:hypothetical protein [Hymenobacter yonginensis]|uniref:RDD domain-containing protein n=1 Tax=Hymenobacter yonginensis TaxID=748197 RepID=A0ABY7PP46_9BACT|nr:hypothetical protein [Hymenobacter yonginensis]WBO84526.1 hypothetical protein O9Z63_19435 [Hymenobacter yonginensis]